MCVCARVCSDCFHVIDCVPMRYIYNTDALMISGTCTCTFSDGKDYVPMRYMCNTDALLISGTLFDRRDYKNHFIPMYRMSVKVHIIVLAWASNVGT